MALGDLGTAAGAVQSFVACAADPGDNPDVTLARSGLPPEYLRAWSAGQVQAAGGPVCAAWFYPGGGWIASGQDGAGRQMRSARKRDRSSSMAALLLIGGNAPQARQWSTHSPTPPV